MKKLRDTEEEISQIEDGESSTQAEDGDDQIIQDHSIIAAIKGATEAKAKYNSSS